MVQLGQEQPLVVGGSTQLQTVQELFVVFGARWVVLVDDVVALLVCVVGVVQGILLCVSKEVEGLEEGGPLRGGAGCVVFIRCRIPICHG